MEEVATNSPKREVDGDNHILCLKICDKLRRWPSLKQDKWMGIATFSTLKMGNKCGGGGHSVSEGNTVHHGIG